MPFANGTCIPGSGDGLEKRRVGLAGTELQNLRAFCTHSAQVKAEQVRFHPCKRLREVVDVPMAVMQIVDDADVVRMMLRSQHFAHRRQILRFAAPAAVGVEAELALHFRGPLDEWQHLFDDPIDALRLRREVG